MIENSVPRILVVEDEAIVAMQIAKTLRRLGYSVCSASSGEDAIKLAKEERPDLALMDIMLEGEMDGVQAAAHLTTHYGIPVVYLTANGDETTVHRAKLTQPYGYILKPFQEARLRSTVDLALHRRAVANRIQGGLGSSPPVLERLEDAVFAADASLRLVYLNLAGESLINAHLDNVRGMDLAKLFRSLPGDQLEILRAAGAHAMKTGLATDLSSRGMRLPASGSATHAADTIVPVGPSKEDVTGVVVTFRSIALMNGNDTRSPATVSSSPNFTETREAAGKYREGRTFGQGSTGLPGRAAAEQALEAACRQGTHKFAVAFLIDRYAPILQRFGPVAAQDVLVFYSLHFARKMGPTDLLFQWGGPSFLMLLDRPDSMAEVRSEITPWTEVRMEKMIEVGSRSTMLLVSGRRRIIGALDSLSPEELMKQIDEFTRPGGMAPEY